MKAGTVVRFTKDTDTTQCGEIGTLLEDVARYTITNVGTGGRPPLGVDVAVVERRRGGVVVCCALDVEAI